MKAKDVINILNISRTTLTKYHKIGLIKIDSVINGDYIYNDDSVYALIGKENKKHKKINVIYARISNPPKKYLDEQIERLLNFATSNSIEISKIYSDVKSGMNFERNDFNNLIIDIIKGNINLIIIENKDRLVRFGFELLEQISKYYNTKIIVVNNLSEKNFEQELSDDLISIIHYFSMKSYSNRRKLNKIKKELENNKLIDNN
jgi:predicted site-specific integrase-resolvase